jgi:hypothetical protein
MLTHLNLKLLFIENQIILKQEQIDYFKSLENVDTSIIKHEESKLNKLKEKLAIALKNYQLAQGKLETAKNQRNYQEYQEKVNQSRSPN